MFKTAMQLKARIKNLSKGNSLRAQILFRNYVTERFLERLSLSRYSENVILKGGVLIASLVGLQNRSTMDIDATLKKLLLNEKKIEQIVEEIFSIEIADNLKFKIKDTCVIIEEGGYTGVRVAIEAHIENMCIPLKLDFSTGDIITPHEVLYFYPLLFENRKIPIFAYSLETILAEKIETIITRGTVNTRMRDFYDVYIILNTQEFVIDNDTLKNALLNTSNNRGSVSLLSETKLILSEVKESENLVSLWKNYQKKFDYATNIDWDKMIDSVAGLIDKILNDN